MSKKSGLSNLPQPWMKTSREDLVACPFDKHHVVLKSRLIAHICKCRRQYTGEDYATCPFNASHAVLKKDLKDHVENCPDKKKLDSHLFVVEDPVANKILEDAHVEVPPAEELWDTGPSEPYSYLDVMSEKISKLPIIRGPVCASKSKKKKFVEEEVTRHFSINKAETTQQLVDYAETFFQEGSSSHEYGNHSAKRKSYDD